jgi:hypothetical protein
MGAGAGDEINDTMAREENCELNWKDATKFKYDRKMEYIPKNGHHPSPHSIMVTYEESTETFQ